MSIFKTKTIPAFPKWLEFVPLLIFFIINYYYDIYYATLSLIIFSIINAGISYFYYKKFGVPLNISTIVTVILAVIFGTLTIVLHNPYFLQIKLTIINLLFAIALAIGLLIKKNLLKLMLQQQISLTNKGWNLLTISWIIFFIILAISNEIIRKTMSLDHWVTFKVFGILILTIIFAIIQAPLIAKHVKKEK